MDVLDRYEAAMSADGGLAPAPAHSEEKEYIFMQKAKKWQKVQHDAYFRTVMHPEEHLSKIPTLLPQASAVTRVHQPFTITPNASGKFLMVIDPLCSAGFLYQDAGVNGTGGGTVTNLTIAQDSTIIDEWRLVGASLIMRYYGNFQNMAGFFVGAVTSNRDLATQATFLNFDNVENLTGKVLSRAVDGIKLIYTPSDTLSQEYASATVFNNSTHPAKWQNLFVVYGDNFPNTSCIRVELNRVIEFKAKPSLKEYIPHVKDLPCPPCDASSSGNVFAAPPVKKQVENSVLDQITSATSNALEIAKLANKYILAGQTLGLGSIRGPYNLKGLNFN